MKKVLIISYYFPPSGGPGVQRILKFVKYLPEFGWEPIVLTVKDGDFPARDESLLSEIPVSTKVYRTDIFEPYNFYRKLTGKKKGTAIDVNNINLDSKKNLKEGIAEFFRATFFIPDGRRGWLRHALKKGKQIIDEHKPDLIFSSSPPYTCALIAMKLKEYSGVKWVSDFRDAWTGYLTTPKRWFIPSAIDRKYERETLRIADAVTIVAEGFKEDFKNKYPEISKQKKFELLRNGFDNEDYPENYSSDSILDKNIFNIVYTGSMYGKRNPYFFINTLEDIIAAKQINKSKIKFYFIGRSSGEIQKFLKTSCIKNNIEQISYLPHSESIKYLLNSDAMLLIIDEDIYSKMILSGKVFEYMGASMITGKPIIAIAPEGEASKVINETKSGFIIGHKDKEKLQDVILKLYYDKFKSQNINMNNINSNIEINKTEIMKYDRKNLTKRLAEIFDSQIK